MNHFRVLLLLIVSLANAQFTPTAYYANNVILKDNVYALFWNFTNRSVTFEIQVVQSKGWIGFGLSPNGGMDGSDVVIGFYDQNGNFNFTDRHIIGTSVLVDKSQDWSLLYHSRVNDLNVIKFTRLINTCDKEDLVIQQGAPRIVFAWPNDVIVSNSGDIAYHGAFRASASLNILGSFNQKSPFHASDNIQIYNFSVEAHLLNTEITTYWCQMFKLPDPIIAKKVHLLRIETIIPTENKDLVHHWILFACSQSYVDDYLKNHTQPSPDQCFNSNQWFEINNNKYCINAHFVWAIGGQLIQDFPDGLGLPLGGADSDFTYFFLQYHYNNQQSRQNVVDRTTLRFYVTENLRKTEIGLFTVGANFDPLGIIVPPNTDKFYVDYYCRSDCINKWSGNEPVTVFAVLPHTHLIGVEVYTKVIRDGKEVGYIDKTKNYDFNYQQMFYLQTPFTLKQNDALHSTCVYSTTKKNTYTLSGISTQEEMCMVNMYYYPKKRNTGSCYGDLSVDAFNSLLLQLNKTGDIKLSVWPPTYDSWTIDVKNTLKSSPQISSLLQTFFQNSNKSQSCYAQGEFSFTDYLRPLPASILVENDSCKSDAFKLQPINWTLALLISIIKLLD